MALSRSNNTCNSFKSRAEDFRPELTIRQCFQLSGHVIRLFPIPGQLAAWPWNKPVMAVKFGLRR